MDEYPAPNSVDLYEPESPKPFYKRPGFWILMVIIGLVAWRGTVSYQSTQRMNHALAAFEVHLAEGNLEAAEVQLRVAEAARVNHSRVDDGWRRLRKTQGLERAYAASLAFIEKKQWGLAIQSLEGIKGYKDTEQIILQVLYSAAQDHISRGAWYDARTYLTALPSAYKDAAELLVQVKDSHTAETFQLAMEAKKRGDYIVADRLLNDAKSIGGQLPSQYDAEVKAIQDLKAKQLAAEAAKAAQARLERIRENHKYYTSGPVAIAVGNAELRSRVGNSVAQGNGTFVVVYVDVKNNELSSEHANPLNFTLSTPDGHTVPPDTGTYGLNNYFSAVNLNKGQSTAGWVAFYTRKADTYTLHYRSSRATASKEMAPK